MYVVVNEKYTCYYVLQDLYEWHDLAAIRWLIDLQILTKLLIHLVYLPQAISGSSYGNELEQ